MDWMKNEYRAKKEIRRRVRERVAEIWLRSTEELTKKLLYGDSDSGKEPVGYITGYEE